MTKDKKAKISKILFLETTSENYAFYRNMYLTLKRFCKKILHFNRRENYFRYGKDEMNNRLLSLVKKEKPDYIFTWLTWDEFYLDTLLKIKEISPNTKTVAIFGDDVTQFIDFSRYYALFFDYYFTTIRDYVQKYKKDKLPNVFHTSLTDTINIHPMDVKKKYGVSFIGSEKSKPAGRYEFIKYLKDNKIDIHLFGLDWGKYPELRDIYKGTPPSEEMVKIMNQTKINLCLSKTNLGIPQMKAKIFEVNACNSFSLCEHAKDYEDYFKIGKEIVFFKTKEELLDKVKYYLKHEKQRQKIAENAYKKTIKEYSLSSELKRFFDKTNKTPKSKTLPKLKKQVFVIKSKEIKKTKNQLKEQLKNYDYISFITKDSQHLKYKDYLQVYSLNKTKKQISCCNYYVYSKNLGDYLLFFTRNAYGFLNKDSADSLLDINQLLVTKKYFLEHLDKFKKAFNGKSISFLNNKNTAFIAIPLVRIKKIKTTNHEILKHGFDFKFVYKLYSLTYQKKFFNKYFLLIFLESLNGKLFILKELFERVFSKGALSKLKKM